jgi:hypothetical protein
MDELCGDGSIHDDTVVVSEGLELFVDRIEVTPDGELELTM